MTNRSEKAFVIEWRSPTMPAPAFWYYRDARRAAETRGYFDLFTGYTATLRQVRVPATTPFLD